MGDQRIEGRPPLGGVEMGDRGRIAGVRPEPVDRLGRERDQAALAKAARGLSHGGRIGRQNLRFQAHLHRG